MWEDELAPNRINEAVFLLGKYAPDVLEACKQANADIRNELVPGVEMGTRKGSAARSLEIRARADVICRSLDVVIRESERGAQKAQREIANGKRVSLITRVVLLTSQSAALGSLGLAERHVALITGTLALLASIGTIWAEASSSILGNAKRLAQAYIKLNDLRYEADVLHGNLGAVTKLNSANSGELDSVIERLTRNGNAVCRRLTSLLAEIGVVPRSDPRSGLAV